jgi:hypothetical protein
MLGVEQHRHAYLLGPEQSVGGALLVFIVEQLFAEALIDNLCYMDSDLDYLCERHQHV